MFLSLQKGQGVFAKPPGMAFSERQDDFCLTSPLILARAMGWCCLPSFGPSLQKQRCSSRTCFLISKVSKGYITEKSDSSSIPRESPLINLFGLNFMGVPNPTVRRCTAAPTLPFCTAEARTLLSDNAEARRLRSWPPMKLSLKYRNNGCRIWELPLETGSRIWISCYKTQNFSIVHIESHLNKQPQTDNRLIKKIL